jgi:hypothetical protein
MVSGLHPRSLLGFLQAGVAELVLHTVAETTGGDHVTVLEEAVEDGGNHDVVSLKHLSPVLEGLVGGDDGGAPFVAAADQLEEEAGPLRSRALVTQLVGHQEIQLLQVMEAASQGTVYGGSDQLVQGSGDIGEEDPFAGLAGLRARPVAR